MKARLSILCLITALCLQALGDDKQVTELARPLLDAAAKPFPEFARITTGHLYFLNSRRPALRKSSLVMTSVRDLLWKCMSTLDLTMTESNKQEQLENLTALCSFA